VHEQDDARERGAPRGAERGRAAPRRQRRRAARCKPQRVGAAREVVRALAPGGGRGAPPRERPRARRVGGVAVGAEALDARGRGGAAPGGEGRAEAELQEGGEAVSDAAELLDLFGG
jgi:hypothetical protein